LNSVFSKRAFLILAVLGLGGLVAQENQSTTRTLKLKLSYTGTGTVDEKHKLYVFLFDSPDFIKGEQIPPIGAQSASAKSETLTFTVTTSPVYIVAAYDIAGSYDGQSGPPPSGSPVAVYSTEPGAPAPIKIEAGKTAEVELAFDDTIKMP
jgi:hypothetical protein